MEKGGATKSCSFGVGIAMMPSPFNKSSMLSMVAVGAGPGAAANACSDRNDVYDVMDWAVSVWDGTSCNIYCSNEDVGVDTLEMELNSQ